MKHLLIWRILTLTGLFGLIFLILGWNGWITPVQKIPRSIELLILLVPLLLLVRGLLHGRYSTHVKAAFPTGILYFILGVWYALTPKEEIYGYLLILFSFMLYLGGFLYARAIMKHEKAEENASNNG